MNWCLHVCVCTRVCIGAVCCVILVCMGCAKTSRRLLWWGAPLPLPRVCVQRPSVHVSRRHLVRLLLVPEHVRGVLIGTSGRREGACRRCRTEAVHPKSCFYVCPNEHVFKHCAAVWTCVPHPLCGIHLLARPCLPCRAGLRAIPMGVVINKRFPRRTHWFLVRPGLSPSTAASGVHWCSTRGSPFRRESEICRDHPLRRRRNRGVTAGPGDGRW